MKKTFLYTALGLMGIMGTLSMGVVNAANTSCWSKYITTIPSDSDTYATGIVYGCDNETNPGKSIPIITIYGENANGSGVGITIKAMNEGTGTVTIGSGYDESSYGALYQWGNSYPFPNVSDTTTPINSGSSAVSAALYGPNTTSGYYYSGTWIKQNVWDTGYNVNLRGGAGDMGSNGLYSFQNFNTTTFIDANSQDRQVMCPEGYHIPSQGEWHALFYLWGKNYDESKKTSLFENVSLNNLISVNSLDGAGMSFSSDMQIPFANSRVVETNPQTYSSYYGRYWSSSPANGTYSSNKAYLFMFYSGQINTNSCNDRGVGMAVRCFKNSYVEPPQTFTVTFDTTTNGGNTPQTGSVQVNIGDTLNLTEYTATKTDWEFIGWNTSSGATTKIGDSYEVNGDVTLYAIFKKTPRAWTIESGDFRALDITGIDGKVLFTIMDRNLGAEAYMNEAGKEASQWYGKYYQWGNNYGFDNTGSVTTSGTTVDTTGYGPGNYYSSSTFIIYNSNWSSVNNENLWGGENTSNLDSDRQGPCPAGYHVPDTLEWKAAVAVWCTKKRELTSATACEGNQLQTDLLLPFAGYRTYSASKAYRESDGHYWSSSPVLSDAGNAYNLNFNSSYINPQYNSYKRATGFSVRCFKNSSAKVLTFNANTGGTVDTNITQTVRRWEDGIVLPTPTNSDSHKVFSGWYTNSEFSGSAVTTNALSTDDSGGTITLYAKWTCPEGRIDNGTECTQPKNTVTFNYEVNGGTAATSGSVEVISGGTINLSLYTGTKVGWKFIGWNTDSGATAAISTKYNAYPITGDITLYAIFKKEGITLTGTIISNGATVDSTETETGCNTPTIYNNEPVVTECTLTFPTATRTNGTVYGYSTNSGADTPTITNGGTGNISANTTFYVISKSDDIILHVNYLSGVGVQSIGNDSGSCTLTGTWNSTEQATSCTVTAPSITLKPGYGTGKWSSGSIEVLSGNDITLTADDTYTASATPNTYTVSYDAKGGDGTITDQVFTYDLSGNLAENTFTKTGYVFSGWKYNDEIYTGNQEIKNLTGINGATITMVTQWAPITYSVEFTGTDVSGTMLNQDFTYDVTGSLTANAFTKTGYIFSGWTYGTTGYADEQNVSNLTTTDGATVTLTAQWTPITYTISFSGNAADATGTAPATINAEYDSGDIAPDNSFTLTGYTFTGWNTESDGRGTGYATGGTLKNLTTTGGDVVTLYAQWEVNVYKLNFVVDGTTIQSGDVAYAAAISAPAEPKKDCNSFAGWTSSVEGLTTTGTMPDSDVTFTANWNYTCSRSSGGGGGGSSRNTEKSTETQTGSKVDSSTKATDNEDNTQDSSAKASEGQNQGKTYSDEFQQAYEFAYKHGITTMDSIEKADMEGPLTRIAMAKMLSYYAINVLGQKPDTSRKINFKDVSAALDKKYDNGVTLAYQLGIMGINMKNNKFRPNDLVTRAEFGTALSRMLYGIADGKDKYYSTHLAKLMEEKIITNDDPKMRELRGYVMIMLMRSAENK